VKETTAVNGDRTIFTYNGFGEVKGNDFYVGGDGKRLTRTQHEHRHAPCGPASRDMATSNMWHDYDGNLIQTFGLIKSKSISPG
jgi:hypothetical protein